MAEHSTVNRRVAGSSPAWGVFITIKVAIIIATFIFCFPYVYKEIIKIKQIEQLN